MTTCEKCGQIRSSMPTMSCGGCLAKARGETPRKVRKPTKKELDRVMKFLGLAWNGDRHARVYSGKKLPAVCERCLGTGLLFEGSKRPCPICVERIEAAMKKVKRPPEPSCNCAGQEDTPIGGHKLTCPRHGMGIPPYGGGHLCEDLGYPPGPAGRVRKAKR